MTTQTTSLTDFLLARIAEDEAVARRAAGDYRSSTWHLGEFDETVLMYPPSSPEKIAAVRERFGDDLADEHARWSGQTIQVAGDEVAPHIARHDPARVLAQCKAHRRIIEFHQSWPVLAEGPTAFESPDTDDLSSMALRASRQIAWLTEQEYRAKFGDEPPTAPMLLALAAVYGDHPDFREEWRA